MVHIDDMEAIDIRLEIAQRIGMISNISQTSELVTITLPDGKQYMGRTMGRALDECLIPNWPVDADNAISLCYSFTRRLGWKLEIEYVFDDTYIGPSAGFPAPNIWACMDMKLCDHCPTAQLADVLSRLALLAMRSGR